MFILKLISVLFLLLSVKDNYWITVNKGAALYLNPFTSKWVPIGQKEELRQNTYILTKEHSEIIIYDDDKTVVLGSNMYVYLNDLFVANKNDLISKLTKIQMDQLPNSINSSKNKHRVIGLTFGKVKEKKDQIKIPYLKERVNTINHLDKNKNTYASLLGLKRLMTKYPDLYFDYEYTKKLFSYYEQFDLKGMIYDESLALKQTNIEGELKLFVKKSHEKVKDELMKNVN